MFDNDNGQLIRALHKTAEALVSLSRPPHATGYADMEELCDSKADEIAFSFTIPCESITESHQVQRQLETLKEKLSDQGLGFDYGEDDAPEERQALSEQFGDFYATFTLPVNLTSAEGLNAVLRDFARERAHMHLLSGHHRAVAALTTAFPDEKQRNAELRKIRAGVNSELASKATNAPSR